MISDLSIERVLAPNPGPYTGPGTNTWVVGNADEVVVLDPGPVIRDHMTAITEAVGARTVSAVVVTHTHVDHAPLANPLARECEAPAVGYAAGEQFVPDDLVGDGSVIQVAGHSMAVVHTPGHSDDHLCFRIGNALFTGDHIMGGSSVMVEDMGPYLASLEKIHHTGLTDLYPGHGEQMDQPDQVISWYLAHRMQREREITEALVGGAITVGGIVEVVYAEVDTALHPLAARSVVAHLRKLASEGRAHFDGGDWESTVRILDPDTGD